jgi:TP901 family phage tail tape measure protein
MAETNANIRIGVETAQALAAIKQLQREISIFHTLMAKGGAKAAAESRLLQQGLINSINETGKFSASMASISSSTESFTTALEKNKLSMGQYFRYAGGASRSFGKMFSKEFNTISRVAEERVKDLQTQYVSMGRDANGVLQSIKVRPLALDMENLGTKVMLTSQKQQIFNQLLKQGTTNLLNFGKNTQWAGRQLMVGFTIPLTIFGATAAREFQKIEEQAVKFRRVYGDMFNTEAETEKALQNIRDLANEFTKYGIAVEKTIGLAAQVAQMGNVGTALTEQVTQATRLAVLGGMEQEEALNTTISLTNAFGIAAEDLAGKIAFLNAAENQTILSIEDFNTAIPLAGSVVQQLGGDVEDLAFFLTAMREGGINASQGANALKTSLARLVAPTEVAKKEMAGFGIDIVGIVEQNAGNLKNTVMVLAQELDKLDPLNRARAIEQLFGKFQFARMSTMFQNIVKDGSQANKVLDLTAASTAELAVIAERELKRVEESPAFKLQKQMEQLKASLAPIGEEFVKAILPIVEMGTKLLKSFNNLGDGGKQFVVVLTALAGVVAPAALMAFGLVANGVANLLKFFSFLGNSLGMISGKSNLLGVQTEYMTQQQIDAAAVAASLAQTHSGLTQIFTAEAGALQSLAGAYRAAIAEQRAFDLGQTAATMARVPYGPQPKPRGYAQGGIVTGPGTGTSDSIFAMISNGEAVIPAAMVKKYGPFIDSIIADNVPGYSAGNKKPARAHTAMPFAPGTPQYDEGMAAAGFDKLPESMKQFASVVSNLVAELDSSMNILLQKGTAPVEEFEKSWNTTESGEKNTGKYLTTARKGGLDTSDPENVAALQIIEDEIGKRAAAIARGTESQLVSDEILAQAAQEVIAEYKDRDDALGKAGSALEERRTTVGQARLSIPTDEMKGLIEEGVVTRTPGTSGLEANGVNVGRVSTSKEGKFYPANPAGRSKGGYSDQPLASAAAMEAAGTPISPEDVQKLEADMARIAEGISDGLVGGLKTELEMNSPSKRMFNLGKNAGDSLADGFESSAVGPKGNDPKLPGLAPPPPPPSATAGPTSKSGQFFSNLKGKAATVGNKAMDLALETGPGKKVANYFAETSGADITNSQGKVVSTLHQEIKDLGNAADVAADQIDENTQSVKKNGEASSSSKGAKSDIARDSSGNPIMGADGKPLTNKQVKQAANQQKRQARAGKAAMIAGTATMAAGALTQVDVDVLGFNIGELAQKFMPLIAGAAMLGPILLAMSGPAALAVLAIGGIVAGYMAYQAKLKEVTEAARELAENLGAGSKAMGRFAEFAGKATPTEIMNEQRQLGEINVAMGKSEFGENFVASEQGKEFMETIEKGFSEIGRSDTMTRMGVQLATAVSSNILTAEQAAGIAAEIGREMGDLSISMDLLGNLTELIGPGGQDLLTDPLEVFMKVIDISAEDTAESIDSLMQEIINPGGENNNGFFSGLFDVPELQAALAGNLIALQEQVQGQLDAQTVAHEKNIANYKEENALLEEQAKTLEGQGRSAEAAEKRAAIATNQEAILKAENQYLEDRAALLEKARTANSQILDQQAEVASLQEKIATIGDVSTFTGGGGDIEVVREALRELEQVSGQDIGLDLDTASPEDLRKKYRELRDELGAVDNIAAGFEGTLQQMGAIITERLEEDDPLRKMVDDLATDTELDYNVRFNLIQGMATGAIDIQQVEDFLNDFPVKASQVEKNADLIANKRNELVRNATSIAQSDFYAGMSDEDIVARIISDNQRIQESFANIVSGLGQGANQQLMNIFGKIDDLSLQEDITGKIGLLVEGGSPEELDQAQQMLDMFSMLASYGENTIDREATMAFYLENPDAFTQFQSQMSDFDAAKEEFGEDLTAEVVLGAVFEADTAEYENFKLQSDYFNSLPAAQQKVFLSTFLTQFATIGAMEGTPEGDEAFANFKAERTAALGSGDTDSALENIQQMTFDDFVAFSAAEAAKKVTSALVQAGVLDDLQVDPPGGGGGAEPQIDSLLKKLRDLRIATIDMKKGWEGMQEVLANVFGGGQNLNVFEGLSNQIRGFGVGENLIQMIVGMDPDEYEKRKHELFVFDEAGNITDTTDKLKNMNAAFNAVAMGEYVNTTQATIQGMQDQSNAMDKLIAAGATYVDAYKMVQNQALATAIAQSAGAEEVQQLIELSERLAEMTKKNEEESKRNAAAEAVRQTNEEFANQVAVLNKLAKSQGQYSDAQIEAIMGDKNLQTLMLNPSIDQAAFNQALRDAEKKAEVELRIKLATTEGTRSVFDEGFSKAMDAFSRQEQEIEIEFNAKVDADEKTIKEAEEQIAKMQYQLDDYNAELERISWQEEDINDKYEKRFEALEDIESVNARIAKQQQSQLTIADALSRGDIAAAARAQQELRAQQAADATQEERERLEKAQQAQIENIKSASGLSREDLEDRIKMLERDIFNIEETDMEPAQERIRLATLLKESQIEALEVLGKTREEWEKIKSGIDMAEASGYKFKETMQQALDVVEKLMKAYPTEKPPPPPPPPPAPKQSSGGGGGGGKSAPAPQPQSYTVKPGDWLSKIAPRYGISTAALVAANPQIKNKDLIFPGQKINIPGKAYGGLIDPAKMSMGGFVRKAMSGPPSGFSKGGLAKYARGGLVSNFLTTMASGGFAMGSDTIPAMLTPGEFVIRRPAVQGLGVKNLEQINRGEKIGGSVYNYNLNVNVKSDSDPSQIARTVMSSIRQVENKRIRGNRF